MVKKATYVAVLVLLALHLAHRARANECRRSHLNADSVASGTCTMGEDSATLCRMEWNGGTAEASSGSPPPGLSGKSVQNERRYQEIRLEDTKLKSVIIPILTQYLKKYPKEVYSRASAIPRPTDSRLAAEVINRQLWRDFPDELAWPVTFLAARTYYPFAENEWDDSEALTRMLASSAPQWTSNFADNDAKPIRFEIKDEVRDLRGELTASTDCLDVEIGSVLVVVKGPRGRYLGNCGR